MLQLPCNNVTALLVEDCTPERYTHNPRLLPIILFLYSMLCGSEQHAQAARSPEAAKSAASLWSPLADHNQIVFTVFTPFAQHCVSRLLARSALGSKLAG